jgi:hypothetical protein
MLQSAAAQYSYINSITTSRLPMYYVIIYCVVLVASFQMAQSGTVDISNPKCRPPCCREVKQGEEVVRKYRCWVDRDICTIGWLLVCGSGTDDGTRPPAGICGSTTTMTEPYCKQSTRYQNDIGCELSMPNQCATTVTVPDNLTQLACHSACLATCVGAHLGCEVVPVIREGTP